MVDGLLLIVMAPSEEILLPPLLPVTDDDHGPWVITVSTILLIITTLATIVTLISRIRVLRKASWSDSVACLSCVSDLAYSNYLHLTSRLAFLYSSDRVYQYS